MTEREEPLAARHRRVVDREEETVAGEQRLRALLDAATAVGGDLDLPGTLSRIVEAAARLADARYAALGMLDADGRGLAQFVSTGFDEETIRRVGAPPRGLGVLGLLITDPSPVRLADIRQHPASYGFPPHHPPMTSFLGVPIRVGGRVFGNLYLTEKRGGGEFSREDEEAVVALASTAGVAVANAELFQAAQRREQRLTATAEIQRALLANVGVAEALGMVARHAREAARTSSALVVLIDSDGELRIEAVAGLPASLVGERLAREHPLTDLVDHGSRADLPAEVALRSDARLPHGLLVPFAGPDGSAGGLIVAGPEEQLRTPHADELSALEGFANQAALALDLTQAREDRSSLTLLGERDRIARDLHDVVIQRLFATGLGLQALSRQTDQPEVAERLRKAVTELDVTIRDIRTTIFELTRNDAGDNLRSQISDVVAAARASLKLRPHLVVDGPVESVVPDAVRPHLVATLIEGLSNVARHARATRVEVRVALLDDVRGVDGLEGKAVRLVITDDGVGFAGEGARSGLANMLERAEMLGGSLEVTSAPGQGTTLAWTVPLDR